VRDPLRRRKRARYRLDRGASRIEKKVPLFVKGNKATEGKEKQFKRKGGESQLGDKRWKKKVAKSREGGISYREREGIESRSVDSPRNFDCLRKNFELIIIYQEKKVAYQKKIEKRNNA